MKKSKKSWSFNQGYTWFNIIILLFLSKFHPQKMEVFKDNFNTYFLFHCTLSMHLSYTRTGLKVDADNIPEVGGFLSRDCGSKYHNLYIKTPCLIWPFSEFPSMVAIDKFDCIYITNCLMSKFRNTSVLGGHWIYRSCFQILFKIPGY